MPRLSTSPPPSQRASRSRRQSRRAGDARCPPSAAATSARGPDGAPGRRLPGSGPARAAGSAAAAPPSAPERPEHDQRPALARRHLVGLVDVQPSVACTGSQLRRPRGHGRSRHGRRAWHPGDPQVGRPISRANAGTRSTGRPAGRATARPAPRAARQRATLSRMNPPGWGRPPPRQQQSSNTNSGTMVCRGHRGDEGRVVVEPEVATEPDDGDAGHHIFAVAGAGA